MRRSARLRNCLMTLCTPLFLVRADPATGGDLRWVPGSTAKICQLTGDFDRCTQTMTLSRTQHRFGVAATDLGSSFEHKEKLYFLFGDTWGRPGAWDAVAWTGSTVPDKIVLDFHRDEDGRWIPPKVPGIEQHDFEVPSGGISINDVMYVVFTTDHTNEKVMGRSVLARSLDDGKTFEQLYNLSGDRFINVSLQRVGEWLYVYGSGEYRKSSVCLARVPPGDVGDKSKLRYFAGRDADGQARWLPADSTAVPLFRHDVVGEFSVAYLEPVKQFLMLYNSSEPRGIVMRSAPTPWGPWSDCQVIFNEWRDGGYGSFIHISHAFKRKSDTLSDPRRENEWGGCYGPYIMSRYTSGNEAKCRIHFTMSTWNPYQVVVMRSDLTLQPPPSQ